jgi:quinol monooxygenase YgiN
VSAGLQLADRTVLSWAGRDLATSLNLRRNASSRGSETSKGSRLSVTVVIQFQVKPDKVQELLDFVEKNGSSSRAFPGCESFVLHQNQDDPTSFMFIERWKARSDQGAYVESRTEQGIMDTFVTMLAGEPSFGFYDALDV